jgi:hypothetical protein
MSQETVIAAPLTRRLLVKASLSAGFCAAISPVMAQVITTPADGLVAGEVTVPTNDADTGLSRDAGPRRTVPNRACGARGFRRA